MADPIPPRLHHDCHTVTSGSLERVADLFALLGCQVVYRPAGNPTWAMFGQNGLNFALQISETPDPPIEILDAKRQTHIAFISDHPGEILDRVKAWAQSQGLPYRHGGWSDKELYFDLPTVFVTFVIEVMHTSIEEE